MDSHNPQKGGCLDENPKLKSTCEQTGARAGAGRVSVEGDDDWMTASDGNGEGGEPSSSDDSAAGAFLSPQCSQSGEEEEQEQADLNFEYY